MGIAAGGTFLEVTLAGFLRGLCGTPALEHFFQLALGTLKVSPVAGVVEFMKLTDMDTAWMCLAASMEISASVGVRFSCSEFSGPGVDAMLLLAGGEAGSAFSADGASSAGGVFPESGTFSVGVVTVSVVDMWSWEAGVCTSTEEGSLGEGADDAEVTVSG